MDIRSFKKSRSSCVPILSLILTTSPTTTSLELPLPFASYSTYTDTLNLFPEIIELKKDLVLNPSNYFDERDSQESSIRFTFRGEPTVEDPYFYVTAEGGGALYIKKFLYRFHAQTRFAERWNPIKNDWEMICWGDIFMTKK